MREHTALFVTDFFGAVKRRKKKTGEDSGVIARGRLKNALVKDRSDEMTELLEMLAADMVKVVNCYMESAGAPAVRLRPGQSGLSLLCAEVPVRGPRRAKVKGTA